MSRNTTSSAPSSSYRRASSAGSPASRSPVKRTPFTTLPPSTSRQGITLTVRMQPSPPRCRASRRRGPCPTTAPAMRRTCPPAPRRTRCRDGARSAADRTPPDAMTGWRLRARTPTTPVVSGPESIPSRSIDVTTTAPSGALVRTCRAPRRPTRHRSCSHPRTASI